MLYNDLMIDIEPVSGLRKKNFEGKICTEGRLCRVYSDRDEDRKEKIAEVLFVEDYHYTKGDDESFKKFLKQTIDINPGFQMKSIAMMYRDKVSVFLKVIGVMLDMIPDADLDDILVNKAKLTKKELILIKYYDPDADDTKREG